MCDHRGVSEPASPSITCVIPTRDSIAYLEEAIESVLIQSPPVPELLVVDAGSTDGTRELVESYGPPVELVTRPGGPAVARQHGLERARGEFISFLDSDDAYLPGKQARQLERFSARPELEICMCHAEMFWEPGLGDEEARYRAAGRHRGAYLFQTMLARRQVFEKVGPIGPELNIGDVVDWMARARDAGAVIEVLDDVLVRRRMHPASLTHRTPSLDRYVEVVKARLDRVRASNTR